MAAKRRERPRASVSPARSTAFEVLRDVEDCRGEPASLLHRPRYSPLSSVDRDLATSIVLGVLRFRGSLDAILAHHSKRPVAEIDDRLLLALRIGLYQIRHLDRVPARAAVDESVRLAEAFGAWRGKGLVNAVLRSILRRPEEPALPGKERDPVGYLAVTLSHPRWLVERYLSRLGFERAEALCLAQNETPEVHLRVSSRIELERARETLAREGIETEPVAEAPRCLRVSSGSVTGSSLFAEGLVLPQDAGSQLVPLLLDPRPDDAVLDVCAAPGAKATLMSELVPGGMVVAIDRRRRRVEILRELATRLSASNLHPVAADGLRLPFAMRFDRMLLDVPCTSLGTLRRNPDLKWRVEESDLERLSALQLELLRSASSLLREGGRLVYATCSTEPEENERVIEAFLSEAPEFGLVDAAGSLPAAARRMVGPDRFFRTFPASDAMDGYFAAILTRDRIAR